MKKLLGVLAIAGLAMIVSAPGAEAATCWWNGYTWVCRTPPYAGHWWRQHHWREARGPWWRHHHWRPWRHWDYGRPYAWYRY